MEILHAEGCFVCNEVMGHFKSDLSTVTSYSERTIYSLIEAFTDVILSEEVISDYGICQNCLIKFNEYDELTTKAEKIQFDLVQLMDKSRTEELEAKPLIKEESLDQEIDDNNDAAADDDDDDDPIEYEPLDEMYFEETTEEVEAQIEEAHEQFEIIDSTEIYQEDYQLEVVVDDTKENFIETTVSRSNRSATKPSYQASSAPVKGVIKNDEGFLIIEMENNQRVYQCGICSKTCKDKTKLKLHREIHTDQRNVICQICGKGFKTMNCLRNHKRTHLPERIYFKCDQCNKRYTQKVQLKKHIEIVHMHRRDFMCTTCGSSFGTKSVLKMHMLSHSDIRSEQCTICGFKVHTKAKLRRHMKSHTGQRDYECGLCGKKFLYSYNVIAHVRNVHEKNKRSFTQVAKIEEYEFEEKIEST